MSDFEIVEAIEAELVVDDDLNLSEIEKRRRDFKNTYLDWAEASHKLMRMSIILARWDKYVLARDRYLDFRFN